MSDKLFHEVVAEAGIAIDEKWLRLHAQKLEESPVYDAFGWGWTALMTAKAGYLHPSLWSRRNPCLTGFGMMSFTCAP